MCRWVWEDAGRAACPGVARLPPGQQRAEVMGRAGVGADGRGRDEGGGFGPVLAPVVRAVGAQAGGDGLPVHHGACRAVRPSGAARAQTALLSPPATAPPRSAPPALQAVANPFDYLRWLGHTVRASSGSVCPLLTHSYELSCLPLSQTPVCLAGGSSPSHPAAHGTDPSPSHSTPSSLHICFSFSSHQMITSGLFPVSQLCLPR